MYVLFLQASLVPADDVQERVVDANRTYIIGNSMGAL
jgi:predicted alpha/beta superfamily hydrolase